jgi:hypothetical protein
VVKTALWRADGANMTIRQFATASAAAGIGFMLFSLQDSLERMSPWWLFLGFGLWVQVFAGMLLARRCGSGVLAAVGLCTVAYFGLAALTTAVDWGLQFDAASSVSLVPAILSLWAWAGVSDLIVSGISAATAAVERTRQSASG